MRIEWKLREVLKQHNITVYKLSSVSGIPKNTLYNLVNKEPSRIDLGTLSAVLGALDALTGRRVKINDVLERDSEYEFGDDEPVPDNIMERIKFEAGNVKLIPWKQVKAEQDAKRVAALRPIGLDRQEVSEAFLAESLRPLDEDEIEAFYRPELLND